MSRIHVTIDRVALAGFEPTERAALVEGLKTELSRILADPTTRAAWARSRRTPVLRLGRMPLTRGTSGGRSFGNGVARAIGKRLNP
ncbi:MAG TPA: hypothetical protein VHX60_01030 [Acidobacteriaceae bacterium]|jgi:hypothetical protein|nr:hypothetical protein [Acidobacteriaceae bacterium]